MDASAEAPDADSTVKKHPQLGYYSTRRNAHSSVVEHLYCKATFGELALPFCSVSSIDAPQALAAHFQKALVHHTHVLSGLGSASLVLSRVAASHCRSMPARLNVHQRGLHAIH